MTRGGRWRGLTRALTADDSELDADELAQRSRGELGSAAADLQPGRKVTVSGRIRSLETVSRAMPGMLVAELWDGTDAVLVIWLGRRHVPGIAVGRRLTVHGRLGRRGTDKALYNPHYELGAD